MKSRCNWSKVDYIHNNLVEAGFVLESRHCKYSSAIVYSGGKGLIEIELIQQREHELQTRASEGGQLKIELIKIKVQSIKMS